MVKKTAITIGDPSGVGAEIILDWTLKNPELRRRVEVIAHADFLRKLPSDVSSKIVGAEDYKAVMGEPSVDGARVAFNSLELAAQGCIDGIYNAVVTAPISKEQMKKVGFNFAGHTEFFAARWGGDPVMCFAGKKLLMSLVTWHSPLREIPFLINEQNISRAVVSAAELTAKLRGIQNPRIAVCGLNPHAGENGIMGTEEIEIINPILIKLRKKYPNLSISLPPDTVFARQLKGEFDASVAMYHDQGLAPLKALEFDNAVNISMNLPFVRTSPDHGTAFAIAGKGIANSNSFSQAVEAAMKLSN